MLQIVEVGPRDGLQSHDAFVPTERKVQLIERLVAAGLTEIEATSFAHPKMVPHLADAADVMAALRVSTASATAAWCRTRRARHGPLTRASTWWSRSSARARAIRRRTQNMTVAAALEQLQAISEVARGAGVPWMAGISMAFGSPYEDEIPVAGVLDLVDRISAWDPERVYVADTVGGAAPAAVREMCATIVSRWPALPLSVHLHGADARGLACAVAAVDGGAVEVETSICGSAGRWCGRRARRSSGTWPPRRLATTFAELGIETGLDRTRFARPARDVADLLGLAGERLAPDAAEGRGTRPRDARRPRRRPDETVPPPRRRRRIHSRPWQTSR
jgi:hydroxymethylglutaryl-CoA lyase